MRVGLSLRRRRPLITQSRRYRCKAASDVQGHFRPYGAAAEKIFTEPPKCFVVPVDCEDLVGLATRSGVQARTASTMLTADFVGTTCVKRKPAFSSSVLYSCSVRS